MLSTLAGIATFRSSAYRQVAHDPGAFKSAIFVIFVSIISTISATLIVGIGEIGLEIITTVVVVAHLASWLIDSMLIALITNKLFGGQIGIWELLRAFGHVYVFQWLSFIPFIGPIVAALLYPVGIVIAVRESTGLSTGKSIAAYIIARITGALIAIVILACAAIPIVILVNTITN